MLRSLGFRRAIKLHSVRWRNLAVFRAVDAVQADAFSVVVVQDFDGVAVENGDDGAGEVSQCSKWKNTKCRATLRVQLQLL